MHVLIAGYKADRAPETTMNETQMSPSKNMIEGDIHMKSMLPRYLMISSLKFLMATCAEPHAHDSAYA